MNPGAITDVDGILVGHHHRLDPDAALGSGWACGSTVVPAPRAPSVLSTSAAARPAPARPTCSVPPRVFGRSTRSCSPGQRLRPRRRRRRDDLARGAGSRVQMDGGVVPIVSDRGDFRSTGGRLGVQADRGVRLPGRAVRGSPGRGGHGGRGGRRAAGALRADWAPPRRSWIPGDGRRDRRG